MTEAESKSSGPVPNEPCQKRARLAVFDFDGTCIDGNSPVILVRYLVSRRKLRPSVIFRILLWAAAYKLHLPQSESWVRGLVFSAFEGQPAEEVDAFLRRFYDEQIDCLFRPAAEEAMRCHTEQGDVVLVVSATFEPIIEQAMLRRPFEHGIATRMKVASDGTYTRCVDGTPTEGAEKLAVVRRFGDEHFGPGCWELAYAYGDHYSDRTVIAAAEHPFAVTPGSTLERYAKEHGWPVLEW